MMIPCRVRTRRTGSLRTLDLDGDFTHESEAPLAAALHDPQVSSQSVLLLNFTDVAYINSAGISLLVSLVADFHGHGRQLAIYGLSPHYAKIFRMVGLTGFLKVFDTEQQALAAFPVS